MATDADAIVEELSAHDPELVRAVCTKFADVDDFGVDLVKLHVAWSFKLHVAWSLW